MATNDTGDQVSNEEQEDYKTNLIINYLPQSMTEEEVKSLFSTIGPLKNHKLIKDKSTKISLGYAFVSYQKPEDAERAIQTLNGLKVQNKILKVSFARPSSDAIKGANLYVSGLPNNFTEKDIEELFRPYGDIISSRLLNGGAKLLKGVAFIRYNLRDEAEQAIKELNGKVLNGTTEGIIVKFAQNPNNINKKAMTPIAATYMALQNNAPRFAGAGPIHHQLGRIRYSPMGNELGPKTGPMSPLNPLIANNLLNNTAATPGWNIFVYNLAPDAEESILWQLFGPFGAVQSVKIIRNQDTNECKGFGFVKMMKYEEAVVAIQSLNGYSLGNRVLQVSFKTNKGK